jgi:hypothetical protein
MTMHSAQNLLDNVGSVPFSLSIDTIDPLTKHRRPLLTTRAVETKAGWCGQILVLSMIIVESEPFTDVDSDDPEQFALDWANTYVVNKIVDLLVGTGTP